MKKAKLVVATLAATVFTASAGALVACGELDEFAEKAGVYEITFNANGGMYESGTTIKVPTVDGRVLVEPDRPTNEDQKFNGYTVNQDGSGTKITFGENGYKFTKSITVYAQWTTEPQGDQSGVYEITYDANGGILIGNNTMQTANGQLAWLLTKNNVYYAGHTFVGWYTAREGGDEVTTDYVFERDTTIFAHWTVDGSGNTDPDPENPDPNNPNNPDPDNPDDNKDPNPTTTEAAMTVGGVEKTATWRKKPAADLDTANGQTGEYYAAEVTLSAGDEIAFKVNGTPVKLWRKYDADATQDARNKIEYVEDTSKASESLVISASGTYTVSITNWDNAAEWVVWVGEPNYTGPEIPDVPGTGAVMKVDGVVSNVKFTKKPESELQTQYGQKAEYYAVDVELYLGDTLSFTVDGEAIKLWADTTDENNKVNTVTESADSLTVKAAGTYTVSIKYYNDDPHWVVWVGEPNYTEPDPDIPSGTAEFYLYATVGNDYKWSVETGYAFKQIEPDDNEKAYDNPVVKKYIVENVAFSAGDEAKIFYTKGSDDAQKWSYNHYEYECLGTNCEFDGNNLNILKTGKFTFYLKIYANGTDSVWVHYSAGSPDVDPPTPGSKAMMTANGEGTEMTDNSSYIDPEENPTLTIEYMLTGQKFEAQTTLQFKVSDSAVEMWVECKDGLVIDVEGQKVTGTGSKGARGMSITVAAGTYDFYLQYYTDGGADNQGGWRLWVAGESSGTPETPDVPDTEVKTGIVVAGKTTELVVNADASGEKLKVEYWLGANKTIHLNKGAEATFKVDGKTVSLANVEGYGIKSNGSGGIEVTEAGDFVFYLKNWSDTGNWTVYGTNGNEPESQEGSIVVKFNDATVTFKFEVPSWATSDAYLYLWNGTSNALNKWEAKDEYSFTGKTLTINASVSGVKFIVWFKEGSTTKQTFDITNQTLRDGYTYTITMGNWGTNEEGTGNKFEGKVTETKTTA
ncbi:MAG: InlB B-repeat-containing protein [Clostridiales bacterium]|nr:InlB B-repeat-containing protein [Clostridiales bacterium]